jgi:NADH dehydrogenase
MIVLGTDIVTGAFGYIGRYITAQLLDSGRAVKTITTHIDKPNPFGERVKAYPYNFDHPELLKETLQGAETIYNTYWVRFNYGATTFSQAVRNTEILFQCAAEAGVQKIVHISVTNASEESLLPYYEGKAQQEQALRKCNLPYAIVRPTLVFGKEDILVNNIAWLIRKFPIFPIFGDGQYRLQPVFVADLASIAIDAATKMNNDTIDAIGPEDYTFEKFVHLIAAALRRKVVFVKTPARLGIFLGNVLSLALRDVLLTQAELDGLMMNMLTSDQEPNARTKFSNWLSENKHSIGSAYSSELARHFHWNNKQPQEK